MKVLILGGTGACGVLTCRYALQAGHKLVVYARSPNKLPKGKHRGFSHITRGPVSRFSYIDLASHDDVTVVTGELTNLAGVREALEGVNAIISSIGPAASISWTPNYQITNGYKVVLEAMRSQGVKRIIVLGTPSIVDPADPGGLLASFMLFLTKVLMPGAYRDIVATGELFTQADDIDWTIVRVPALTSSPGTAVVAGYVGDGKVGWAVRREAYARFVVDELDKREWVRRRPLVSNA